MLCADLGPEYGVVSCYNSLPAGGGAYTLNRLNLRASVEAHLATGGELEQYLAETLPRHVALTAELIGSRIRFLVEQARWFDHDWLVEEGLVARDRFTAMFGLYGVAEAAELLLAAEDRPARYGFDAEADDLVHRLVARIDHLVRATPMPYCEVSGGAASLHAQSGIDTDLDTTAGVRVPVGREPGLYQHIRAVAPNHRHFPAGISDVFRFDPTVEQNPLAVVAVVRGAFAAGMRDFTFEVAGNGFTRVTGYLVRRKDVDAVKSGARHSSTFLGATAIENQRLDDRVIQRP
jgi:YjjI family glycine radical enzyme